MVNLKYGVISEVSAGKYRVSFEEDEIVSDWLPLIVQKTLNDKASWPLEVNEHVVCMMDEDCETGVVLGAIYNDEDLPDEEQGVMRRKFADGTFIEYDSNQKKLTANVQGGSAFVKASLNIDAEAGTNIKARAGNEIEAHAITVNVIGDSKVNVNAMDIKMTGNVEILGPTKITGVVDITGVTTVTGALTASTVASSTGPITSAGGITAAGTIAGETVQANQVESTGAVLAGGSVVAMDVFAGAVSLAGHRHTGVQSGGSMTGFPL